MKTIKSSLQSLLPWRSGVIAILFLFSMHGCKKDTLVDTFTPKTNNNPSPQDSVSYYQSLQDFFNQNGAPKQLFSINPAIYNMLTGLKGGKIKIYGNTFVDSLGNYPSGNINIEFREIYTVKDMILSNKPTVSYGNILVSGGEVYFNATTTSGNSLDTKTGKFITFNIPADTPIYGMQVFVANDNDTSGAGWIQQDSSYVGFDSTYTNYQLYISNLDYNWINCDYYWGNPNPKTTVTINPLVNPADSISIAVYLVFSAINSVMAAYSYGPPSFIANNIPETVTTTVVALGVGITSNKLYFATTSFTVTTNYSTTLTLTPTTTGELKAALDAL